MAKKVILVIVVIIIILLVWYYFIKNVPSASGTTGLHRKNIPTNIQPGPKMVPVSLNQ